jgi:hypothetical protein
MSRTLRTDFWDGKVTTVATGLAVAGAVDAWQVLGDGSAIFLVPAGQCGFTEST